MFKYLQKYIFNIILRNELNVVSIHEFCEITKISIQEEKN